MVSIDEKIFIIINTEDDAQFESGNIYEGLEYGIDFINKHFFIDISFVLTKLYSTIGELPEAYAQALYLLRYKTAMKIEKPIAIRDIECDDDTYADVLLDSDTEKKIINYVTAGDFENTQFLIEHIFSNLSAMRLSLQQLQCLMIDLGCVFCKVPQKNVKINFEKILSCSANSDATKEYLCTLAKEMCEKSDVTVIKTDKIKKIKEYIDSKYYEDLDLNLLSYAFEISQNYLSASFKKEVGISISDYVHKVRIRHAKQFLKNTDKSIKDIARKVGYENIRTFNRSFQKYEGITPTIYRNNSK